MTENTPDVKNEDELEDESASERSAEENKESENDSQPTADDLLKDKSKRVLDKDRFDELNTQAKLYKTFAPVIEKVKDNPELINQILGKNSLEDRVANIEHDRKEQQRGELKSALTNALKSYKDFDKVWPEIEDQVNLLTKKGFSPQEAIQRSYISLHPEEAKNFVKDDSENEMGSFSQGGGRAPNVIRQQENEDTGLNEREKKVAQDLVGKKLTGSFGEFSPFKSEADYAAALKKHDAYLKQRGFYILP